MNLTLKVWRQANAETKGKMEKYTMQEVSPDMSFFRNDGCPKRTINGSRH